MATCLGRSPTPTAAKACGCDADCDLGEICANEEQTGLPGGYCVRGCALSPCPDGYVCHELTSGDRATQACLPRCTTSVDCRPGYLCDEVVRPTEGGIVTDAVCTAHCSSAADCAAGTACDPYYGLCGAQPHPGTGDIGAACATNDDCMSGLCQTGPGFPSGYCTASCSLLTPDCPTGSACEYRLGATGDLGQCLQSCAQEGDCRPGYLCGTGVIHGDSVCFAPIASLAVARSGTGSGAVSGEGISCGADCYEVVPRGHAITLTAVAADGSTFAGWNGCDMPNGATCSMPLDTPSSVVAFFELLAAQSTLTVTKSGSGFGTVTGPGIVCGDDCNEAVARGSTITLLAAAASGATFTGWSGCDTAIGATCTLAVATSKTVNATFGGACTPEATRCIRNAPGAQQRCNTAGTWVEEGCGPLQICAGGSCRAACGMTSVPADPTVCVVPIADGVNNGEWAYSTDGRVAVPTFVVAGTGTRLGRAAEILPAPGATWPFMWRLGAGDIAGVNFRLDQFRRDQPDAYRHPVLGYRVRQADVQTNSSHGLFVGMFDPTRSIGTCTSVASSIWTTDVCRAVTPYNEAFDYAGGVNSMFLSVRGPGSGGVLDLVDVNYAYLTIEP